MARTEPRQRSAGILGKAIQLAIVLLLLAILAAVNGVSQEAGTLGAGVVRKPDAITQPLKFDYS